MSEESIKPKKKSKKAKVAKSVTAEPSIDSIPEQKPAIPFNPVINPNLDSIVFENGWKSHNKNTVKW